MSAKALLGMFRVRYMAFVEVRSDLGLVMSIMARMGFLVLTKTQYRICLPTELDKSRVREATLCLAATVHNSFWLRAETLFELPAVRIYKEATKP